MSNLKHLLSVAVMEGLVQSVNGVALVICDALPVLGELMPAEFDLTDDLRAELQEWAEVGGCLRVMVKPPQATVFVHDDDVTVSLKWFAALLEEQRLAELARTL